MRIELGHLAKDRGVALTPVGSFSELKFF